MLAGTEAARGACTDPYLLPVVDAAFLRPGGPDAHRMVEEVCPTCPIWRECLTTALATGEHGPWGGATERTRRQYVKRPVTYNLRSINSTMRDGLAKPVDGRSGHRARDRRDIRLDELKATSTDVRQWALANGIPVAPKGVPNMAAIEAFASGQ